MADVITKWSELYITDMGLALRQAAIARGIRPAFVYAEIGEGVPNNPSVIPSLSGLVLPALDEEGNAIRTTIKRSTSQATTHFIDVVIDNKDYQTSFLMRELAIYAMLINPDPDEPTDPDLEPFFQPIVYGYSYTTEGYESVPAGSEFHRMWTIGANTAIARSKEITIQYDGSAVYATYADVDEFAQLAQSAYDASQNALAAISEGNIGNGEIVFSNTLPTGDWRLWLFDEGPVPGYPDDAPMQENVEMDTAPLDAPGDFAVMYEDGEGETILNMTDDPETAGEDDIVIVLDE